MESEMIREPNMEELNKFIHLRLNSVHVDYNFEKNQWEILEQGMKQNAIDIIIKAAYARTYLHQELKHRGIRLRKKTRE